MGPSNFSQDTVDGFHTRAYKVHASTFKGLLRRDPHSKFAPEPSESRFEVVVGQPPFKRSQRRFPVSIIAIM